MATLYIILPINNNLKNFVFRGWLIPARGTLKNKNLKIGFEMHYTSVINLQWTKFQNHLSESKRYNQIIYQNIFPSIRFPIIILTFLFIAFYIILYNISKGEHTAPYSPPLGSTPAGFTYMLMCFICEREYWHIT